MITTTGTDIEFSEISKIVDDVETLIVPTTALDGATLSAVQHYSAQSVDITAIQNLPYSSHTYYTELDYINTSFCDGKVRVFYNEVPLDDDGFPLIPDNQNYKQAIYWHVRAMMIGCGFNDPVFKYTDCEARFEKHAARALGEIQYPSVDQVEAYTDNSVRLLFNEEAFGSFFNNSRESNLY